MEYSAGNVSNLLWFIETRETIKLLQKHTKEEVIQIIVEENVYQQKSENRRRRQFNCIRKRIEALPEDLASKIIETDLSTAKLITFIAVMATDLLLFEFMYEVFRDKLILGEEELIEADWNRFFNRKIEQSDVIAGWSDSARRKLQQTYCKYMLEAGLLRMEDKKIKKLVRPYIDPELRGVLLRNNMDKYLYALIGEY